MEEQDRQFAIEEARIQHQKLFDLMIDARQSAGNTASSAIKTLMLINGGAVVALLTLLGALDGEKTSIIQAEYLAFPLTQFALGVGLSALSSGFLYFVNMIDVDMYTLCEKLYEPPYIRVQKHTVRKPMRFLSFFAALFAAIASLGLFFRGVLAIASSLT